MSNAESSGVRARLGTEIPEDEDEDEEAPVSRRSVTGR